MCGGKECETETCDELSHFLPLSVTVVQRAKVPEATPMVALEWHRSRSY
jgi:hypothetical protein